MQSTDYKQCYKSFKSPVFFFGLMNQPCHTTFPSQSHFYMLGMLNLSRPESRPDPIGGSEPVSGTRDSGLGLFFFFFLKHNWYLWVWPTSYNRVTISYTKLNFYFYKSERNLHVVNPYKCVGPAVCGCLLMSFPVPTRIKNPC